MSHNGNENRWLHYSKGKLWRKRSSKIKNTIELLKSKIMSKNLEILEGREIEGAVY